jgi:hypothetical protein
MLHVLSDPHLFLIDHYKSVEHNAQRKARYRVEVDCVLFDFDVVPLPVLLVDLLRVFAEVLLANWNYRRVSELFDRP